MDMVIAQLEECLLLRGQLHRTAVRRHTDVLGESLELAHLQFVVSTIFGYKTKKKKFIQKELFVGQHFGKATR
jgi:hypothetical protein